MRIRDAVIAFLTVLALSLAFQPGAAQNLAQVYRVTANSGEAAGFEAAMREHMDWRAEHDDPWTWNVYQVIAGDDLGDYLVRSGNHAWADMDAYNTWGQESGAGPHFGATVAPLVETVTNRITATDTIRQRLPDNLAEMNYFPVTTYHLNVGGGSDFNAAWDQFHAAVVEHDAPFYYSKISNAFGGSGQEAVVVGFSEDWAGMAPPSQNGYQLLVEAYGEDEADEIVAQFQSSFHGTESALLLLRRDLSSPPADGM